jgi:FkbM family methyltransferase
LLNLAIGSRTELEGKTCILTHEGGHGHAVYGPYQYLEAGRYVVEFNLRATPDQSFAFDHDALCAMVDVAADLGTRIFAREDITLSLLRNGPVCIRLVFQTEIARTFEFRVGVTGKIPLLIEDYCRLVHLGHSDTDVAALMDETRFPDESQWSDVQAFRENYALLRQLYEHGALLKIADKDTIVTIDGVSFYARVHDDLRFVDEIFFRSTYNFSLGTECCVIDIGMNIGLVSLTFAKKDEVKEVHSFEPFKNTYNRACENLLLNPMISGKIAAHNFGLAGADEETTVLIYDESDSGQFSIRGSTQGTPEQIVVKDAATVLRPIITNARSHGRRVVAKVDCEGSEFPIFRTLHKNGLLPDISAFMVEWHRGVDGQTQRDLMRPLLENGFLIFDLTTKTGNGFFYAVRCTELGAASTHLEDVSRKDAINSKVESLDAQIQALVASQHSEFTALRERLGLIDFGSPENVARQIAERVGFKGIQANGMYRAFIGSEEPLAHMPQPVGFTSSLCHQAHFGFDQYRYWVRALKDRPLFYRKQWEFVYIAQVLFERGFLVQGKRGIVFGAGEEPLPSLFASFGVEIVATDQAPEAAVEGGWAKSNQHTYDVSALNQRGICTDKMFRELVSFENVDMNNIPAAFDGSFDFCWSACSLEHLGSLQHGFDFIENSMRTLRPGGIAVHTTEFNLSSNDRTYESPNLSIYRRRDIEAFMEAMTSRGFKVSPIDWSLGEGFAEMVVDLPPYGRGEPHIRLRFDAYDVTSIGLIIEKPAIS